MEGEALCPPKAAALPPLMAHPAGEAICLPGDLPPPRRRCPQRPPQAVHRPACAPCTHLRGPAWCRYGRRRVLLTGSAGLAAWMLVLFPLVDTARPVLILVALLGTAVFLGVTYGPLAALFSELFATRVRYSGASLGYQLGSIVGGGLAPTVATALYASSQSSTAVGGYLVGMAVVGLICLAVVTHRSQQAAN